MSTRAAAAQTSLVRKILLTIMMIGASGSTFGAGTFASYNATARNNGTFDTGVLALSNAARHAPGARVEVRLRVDDREAALAVRDWAAAAGGAGGSRPASDAGGHGLAGMRERASLLGGTLRAGPADPGWLVECVIPA